MDTKPKLKKHKKSDTLESKNLELQKKETQLNIEKEKLMISLKEKEEFT